MNVAAIIAGVHADPWGALSELSAVFEDHSAQEAAFDAHREVGSHASDIYSHIRSGTECPATTPESAPSAAWAVDRYLHEETRGKGSVPPAKRHNRYVIALPEGHHRRLESQPGHRQYWMRHHVVVPIKTQDGIAIEIGRAVLEGLGGEELRVYATAFNDGAELDWDSVPEGSFAKGLRKEEERRQSVFAALEEARKRQANVVLMPELTVTPAIVTAIADWLSENEDHPFELVVPGSFHHYDGGKRRNQAVGLDRYGDRLVHHDKLRPMRVVGESGFLEGINAGSTLWLHPSPWGTLALAICLDFCDADGPTCSLWRIASPSLVLVPSMSNNGTMRAHQGRAVDILKVNGAATLIINQTTETKEPERMVAAFVSHSASESRVAPVASIDAVLSRTVNNT